MFKSLVWLDPQKKIHGDSGNRTQVCCSRGGRLNHWANEAVSGTEGIALCAECTTRPWSFQFLQRDWQGPGGRMGRGWGARWTDTNIPTQRYKHRDIKIWIRSKMDRYKHTHTEIQTYPHRDIKIWIRSQMDMHKHTDTEIQTQRY